jgi:hypothetical protein
MVLYVPRYKEAGNTPRTEGRREVVSKVRSLRWLEDLKESQRLTARQERRKEEILGVFRELLRDFREDPRTARLHASAPVLVEISRRARPNRPRFSR